MASNICSWGGLWEAAPDLDVARQSHTATVLKSGKILVCGGVGGLASVGVARLYDPATRAYTPAGSLAVPRHSHQATRLKDGNVLVTGGTSLATGQQPATLASAELYNWMTNSWSLLPAPMSSVREHHTATLTANGDVLIAGGFGGALPTLRILNTIELFTVTSATFTAISHRMMNPRMGHTATLQENNVVLVAGGQDSNGPVATAETYDPAHPPFNPVHDMSTPRCFHAATLIPGRGVLLTGGAGPFNFNGNGFVIQSSAELFTGGLFQQAGGMATARASHAAVDIGDGEVLVCGGENAAGPVASAELFVSGFFRPAGNVAAARVRPALAPTGDGGALICGGTVAPGATPGAELASSERYDPLFRLTTSRLPEVRERFTATRYSGENAFVIGGRHLGAAPTPITSVLFYRGANETFTQVGSLVTARSSHSATLLAAPDRILVVGGETQTGVALASAELYDVATSAVVPVGQPVGARTGHTATLLRDGKVLIVGGTLAGHPLATAELFDPVTNVFTSTASLTYGRGGHTATLLPNGTVLIAGGMSTDSAYPPPSTGITYTTEIYDPAAGTFAVQPQPNRLQTNRTNHSATVLPDGRILFAGGLSTSVSPTARAELYDPASNTFTATGSMLAARHGHSAVATGMAGGQVMIVAGLADLSSVNLRSVELYDPTSGTFSATGDCWFARSHHAAVLTRNQQVLVIGGRVDGIETSAELSKPTDCSIQYAGPASGCFIATAAFGSELHPEVERLRRYRDEVLARSRAGRALVRLYYRCSPPIARLVGRSPALRALVRFALRRR